MISILYESCVFILVMLRSTLVDYNPLAFLLNHLVTKIPALEAFSNYLRGLLFNKDDAVLERLLFLLGVGTITYKTVQFLHQIIDSWSWLPKHFLNSGKATAENLRKRYGNCYVCITGFTEGIGKAYAEIFASFGFNLLLIGRNPQKVHRRVQQLKYNFKNIDIQYFISNLADFKDINQLQKQFNKFAHLDIGIMINNAGSIIYGSYLSLDPRRLVEDIHVDIYAVFVINRIMIPRLRSRQPRSAIINVSSCTGVYLSPRLGIYSAAKKSINLYSKILSIQNNDKIDILSLTPFGVSTGMMLMRKGNIMITPKCCVIGSLQDLLGGLHVSFGYITHKLGGTAFRNISEEKLFEVYNKGWEATKKQAEP